mmetsp:Transcript_83825/g.241005  ORF Transcript_83825/g.241005 Transcript_83825/m.241005 type:complete len:242 (+) Transcript_83825:342-1067(+)
MATEQKPWSTARTTNSVELTLPTESRNQAGIIAAPTDRTAMALYSGRRVCRPPNSTVRSTSTSPMSWPTGNAPLTRALFEYDIRKMSWAKVPRKSPNAHKGCCRTTSAKTSQDSSQDRNSQEPRATASKWQPRAPMSASGDHVESPCSDDTGGLCSQGVQRMTIRIAAKDNASNVATMQSVRRQPMDLAKPPIISEVIMAPVLEAMAREQMPISHWEAVRLSETSFVAAGQAMPRTIAQTM